MKKVTIPYVEQTEWCKPMSAIPDTALQQKASGVFSMVKQGAVFAVACPFHIVTGSPLFWVESRVGRPMGIFPLRFLYAGIKCQFYFSYDMHKYFLCMNRPYKYNLVIP